MTSMDSNIVKFPSDVSRRVPALCRNNFGVLDNQASAGGLPANRRQNQALRDQRHEVWRSAEVATDYWRARLDFERAVLRAQNTDVPEGRGIPWPKTTTSNWSRSGAKRSQRNFSLPRGTLRRSNGSKPR